jgi:hypothetical protein
LMQTSSAVRTLVAFSKSPLLYPLLYEARTNSQGH